MKRALGARRLENAALGCALAFVLACAFACVLACVLAGCGEKDGAELPSTFDPSTPQTTDTTPTVPDVGDITDVVVPSGTDDGSPSGGSGSTDAIEYILPTDLYGKLKADEGGYQVIDIRSFSDYNESHITQAVNIPGGKQLELRIREVDATKIIVLVTNTAYENASRAVVALRAEYGSDLEVYVLRGGMEAWTDASLPTDYDESLWC